MSSRGVEEDYLLYRAQHDSWFPTTSTRGQLHRYTPLKLSMVPMDGTYDLGSIARRNGVC